MGPPADRHAAAEAEAEAAATLEAEVEAESEAEVGSLLHAVAAAGGLAHGINSEPVRADVAADDAGGYD